MHYHFETEMRWILSHNFYFVLSSASLQIRYSQSYVPLGIESRGPVYELEDTVIHFNVLIFYSKKETVTEQSIF